MLKAVTGVLESYGQSTTDALKQRLKAAGKVASGTLINSVKFSVALGNEIISLEISAADYLKYIDSGRGAGKPMPPVDSILKWIQSRHVQPYSKGPTSSGFRLPQKRDKFGQFTGGTLLQRQTSLAWAIAKSIAKNGIVATPLTGNLAVTSTLKDDVSGALFISLTKIVSDELFESSRNAGIKTQ